MKAVIGALRVDLGLNSASFKKGIKQSQSQMQGFSKGMKASLAAVAASAAAAGAALVTAATRASLGLDRALTEVATLTQDAKANLGQLSDAARGLAREFGGNAREQTMAFYQAISAGAGNVTQATSLLRDANKLAVAGVTDVTTGVNILTTAINAYGRESLSTSAASDAIFTGVRAGKTTVNELSSALGQVIPIASSLGVNFDELVGSVAALTTQGQSTAQAVTGVRAILASVAAPASQAATLAKSLGLEFNTAALEAQGLSGFLKSVIDAAGGSNEQLAKLFGSVEALSAVLAFSGGAGEKFNDILVEMANKAGATDDALKTVSESLSNRYDVAWARIGDTLIDLGNRILPLVVGALEFIAPVMEKVVASVVNGIDRMAAEFTFIKEVISAAFTNIPSAIAVGIIRSMNFVVSTVEEGLNLVLGDINNVIAGLNKLGGSFKQIELFNTKDNNFESLTESFGGLSEAGAKGFQAAIDKREATLTEIAGRSKLLSQAEADLITSLFDETIVTNNPGTANKKILPTGLKSSNGTSLASSPESATGGPLDLIPSALKDAERQAAETAKKMQQNFQNAFQSVGSSIRGVLDGTKSWRDVLSDVLQQIGNIAFSSLSSSGFGGGGFGGLFTSLLGGLTGFATGGSFKVGGVGGVDSQVRALRLTPGETVSVNRTGQNDNISGGNVTITQNMSFEGTVTSKDVMEMANSAGQQAGAAAVQAVRQNLPEWQTKIQRDGSLG